MHKVLRDERVLVSVTGMSREYDIVSSAEICPKFEVSEAQTVTEGGSESNTA